MRIQINKTKFYRRVSKETGDCIGLIIFPYPELKVGFTLFRDGIRGFWWSKKEINSLKLKHNNPISKKEAFKIIPNLKKYLNKYGYYW